MGVRNFIKNVKGSPLWKRTTAGALVLLMLVTLIPVKLSFDRALAADSSSELVNFIVDATADGVQIADDGSWTGIKPGVTYKLRLSFKEKAVLQFLDSGEMTYTLPTGIVGIATNREIDIYITSTDEETPFVIEKNKFIVSDDGKTVTFQFNQDDDDYQELVATNNTQFYLTFDVQFDGTNGSNPIDFGGGIKKNVNVDDSHHASVQKSGYYNSSDNKMHYTVTVTSNGNSDSVSISDVISGEALTMDPDSIQIDSNHSWSTAPTVNGNGFQGVIGRINHNETATITYTASVDLTKAGANGKLTSGQTGNDVTIDDSTGDPTNQSSHHDEEITVSTSSKSSSVAGPDANNKYTVTWTVVVNPECKVPVSGSFSDTIDSEQVFSGTGITIVEKDSNNQTINTINKTWSEVGVSNPASASSWTYNVNDTTAKKYEITYTTTVDASDYIESKDVTNTFTYPYGTTTNSAHIDIGTGNTFSVVKRATQVVVGATEADSYITWEIEANIPKQGFTQYVVRDTFPYQGNLNALDALKAGTASIDVTLDGTAYSNYDAAVAADGKYVDLTFYKDSTKTQAGLGGDSTTHTLLITVTTKINHDWLEAAKTTDWMAGHTNDVNITTNRGNKTASATAYPSLSKITKKGSVGGTRVFSGSEKEYPYYKYEVTVSPVSGNAIEIQDTLPEGLRLLNDTDKLNEYDLTDMNKVFSGDQYWQGTPVTASVTRSATEGNITFTISGLGDGAHDGYYKLVYYATIKDEDSYKELIKKALDGTNHSITLQNRATYNSASATSDIVFTADDSAVLDKKVTNLSTLSDQNRYAEYEVTVNPLGLTLNNGEPMTLTDTFSENLSIDYSSVTFTTNPADQVKVFDVTGNVLTATIPDATPVVITYKSKIFGTGYQNFTNEVSMNGFLSVSNETKNFSSDSSGQGSGYVPSIRIFKHEAGNMLVPLEGAEFKLYIYNGPDVEGTPVRDKNNKQVVVSTGADGMARIQGNQSIDGWVLEEDTTYYIQEVEPPDGYELDDTKYRFTISSNDVADYSNYIYHNNDIMRIKNWKKVRETGELTITKLIDGDIPSDLDLSKITLKVTLTDMDGKDMEYARTLQYIMEHSGTTVPNEYGNEHFLKEDNTYTYRLTDIDVGTAVVKEVITETPTDYDLTKTYRVNSTGDYSSYTTDPSVTIQSSAPQTVDFKNTYTRKNDGRIRIRKFFNFKSTTPRTFYFGLFTDAAGTIRYGSKTVTINITESKLESATGTRVDNGDISSAANVFDKLPYGTYYVFELDADGNPIQAGANMEYVIDNFGTKQGQAVTLSSGAKDKTVEFVNKEKSGSLTVSKTVATKGTNTMDPSDYEGLISLSIVDAKGNTIGSKTLEQISTSVSDAKNVYTITSNAAGDRIYTWQINDVPFGTYEVSETYPASVDGGNYSITKKVYTINNGAEQVQDLSDTAPVSVSVTKDVNPSFAYVNTYTENTGSVKFTKKITGDTPDEAEEFVFLLSIRDREGNLLTGTQHFDITTLDFGTEGVAEVKVKGGSFQTINGIPAGYSYSVTEKLQASTNYAINSSGEINKHYQYVSSTNATRTIDADAIKEAVITNRYSTLAKLAIRKHVSADPDYGGNPAIPTTDEFEIYIDLTNASGVPVSGTYPITYKKGATTAAETTTGTVTFDANGRATIQLCHDWTATISDLEIGYKYRVTEKTYNYDSAGVLVGDTDNRYGYKNGIITDDDEHEITATLALENNKTSNVIVNNLYKEKPTALTITKEVIYAPGWTNQEAAIPDNYEYEIEIDFSTSAAASMPADGLHGSVTLTDHKGTVILKNGETASITGILEGATYTIKETRMRIGSGTWMTIPNYGEGEYGIVKADASGNNVYIKKNDTDAEQHTNTSSTQRSYSDKVRVVNYYMPSVIYVEKLNPSGTHLDGVELGILDTETNHYAKDATGADLRWNTSHVDASPKKITGLVNDDQHEYILREISAPDGYLKINNVRFKIAENNEIAILSANTPAYVALSTTSTVTGVGTDTMRVTDQKTKLYIQKLANYDTALQPNQPLPDAELSIQKPDGTTVSINGVAQTWNSDGNPHEVTGLPFGEYKLVEINPPTGYEKAEPISFTLREDNRIVVDGTVYTPDANGVCTLNMTDKKTIEVYVSKVDATSKDEVAGAALQILDLDGNVIKSWTSEKNGFTTKVKITSGEFILRETVAPDGYMVTTDTRFNVSENGTINFNGIPSYERTNTKDVGGNKVLLVEDSMTQMRISKTDITGEEEISGATLQILDSTDHVLHFKADGTVVYPGDTAYDTSDDHWISGDAGPKVIYGLKANAEYKLREQVAPRGYKRITTDTVFFMNEYGVVTSATGVQSTLRSNNLVLLRDNVADLNFSKVGLVNESCIQTAGSAPTDTVVLSGISFTATMINDSGDVITGTDGYTATVSSNASGVVLFSPIPKGKYKIVENPSDTNYKNDTVYYAVVDDDDFAGLYTNLACTTLLTDNRWVNDQYRADIQLTKVSESDPNEKLAGAVYGLYAKDAAGRDIQIASGATDAHGIVTFAGVLINKKYEIREISSVEGYYISKDPISVTFKKDAAGNVVYDTATFDNGGGVVSAAMNGNTLELTWYEPDVTIRVAKVDANNQLLAGAKLQIQDMNGNVVVPTFTSSNTEAKEFNHILNAGKKYQLVEVNVPSRDYMQAAPVEFTMPDTAMAFRDADRIVTVTMVNRKYPEIYVSKVDATTEAEVEGAHIQILDQDGNLVVFKNKKLEWDSKVDGFSTKVQIEPGTYILRETVAPDGYAITTDTKFTVKEDGTIDYSGIPTDERTSTKTVDGHPVLLVKDNMTKVSINKVDVTGDQPLAGAHLRILDENGNPVHIDENGYVVDAGGYTEWISSGDQPKQIYGLKTETVYTLEETVAPSGYTITTKTTFVLDQYGRPDTTRSTVSFNDENVILVRDNATSLNFEKYGTYNESCIAPPESPDAIKPIAGVGFTVKQILDEDGNAVTDAEPVTGESNENGVVIFTKLPKGTYEVQETSALSRYIPDDTIYYAKLTDGAFAGLTYDKEGTKPVENNRLINQVYRTDISFTKVSEINQAKKLANSTYGLFTKKNGTLNRISTAVTDENGVITFKGVLINTEYVVQELVSPDGYYVSKDPITLGFKLEDGKIVFDKSLFDSGNGTVMISADGSLTWLEPEVVVNFLKKDENANPLPGAKLQVVDSNGTIVVEPWISTSTAYQVTAKFKVGETYRLMELAAPDGYEVADPVAFTIDDSTVANGENKIITITMTDKKETKKTDEKKAPKTGDSTPIQLAVLLAMVSLFVGLIMLDRKLFGRR